MGRLTVALATTLLSPAQLPRIALQSYVVVFGDLTMRLPGIARPWTFLSGPQSLAYSRHDWHNHVQVHDAE